MTLLLSLLLVAAVAGVAAAAFRIAGALAARPAAPVTALDVMRTFAPGLTAAADDPRALLVWQPLAVSARSLYPEVFASLDRAAGKTFPFSPDDLQAAHSRWTTDWLAWERSHDAEYKLKAGLLEHELAEAFTGSVGKARLHAIENEKIERYQKRYEEYSRVARALQALLPRA